MSWTLACMPWVLVLRVGEGDLFLESWVVLFSGHFNGLVSRPSRDDGTIKLVRVTSRLLRSSGCHLVSTVQRRVRSFK